jgi:hypothetical protein
VGAKIGSENEKQRTLNVIQLAVKVLQNEIKRFKRRTFNLLTEMSIGRSEKFRGQRKHIEFIPTKASAKERPFTSSV